jgi:hypothetical protein
MSKNYILRPYNGKLYALDRYRHLNVDWFEVTAFYKSPEKVYPKSYLDFFFDKTTKEFEQEDSNFPELVLEYSEHLKHPNYKHGYRLWKKGSEKILIAEFRTHSNEPQKFDPNSFKIKLSNWVLYNDFRMWFKTILFIFKIDSYNITQIDLAFDGATTLKKLIHHKFHDSFDYKYSYHGNNERTSRPFQWNNFNFKTKEYTGFTIGTRKSGLYVNCYEKKQELIKSDKFYIQEKWHSLGMRVEDWPEFQRFEISLKYPYTIDYFRIIEKVQVNIYTGEIITNLNQISINDLSDNYIYSVFDKIYNSLGLTIDGMPIIIGKPSKQKAKKLRIVSSQKTFEQRFYISYLITRYLNEGAERQYEEVTEAIEYSLGKDFYFYSIIKKMLESRMERCLKKQRPKVAKLQIFLYEKRLELMRSPHYPIDIDTSDYEISKILYHFKNKMAQNDILETIKQYKMKIEELRKMVN